MTTYSNILVREIPWTEEPGETTAMGSHSDMTERLTFSTLLRRNKNQLLPERNPGGYIGGHWAARQKYGRVEH